MIEVRDLHFAYRGVAREVLAGISLTVARGRRVLVIGANGAGKTTLLRVLAGKHMVDPSRVRVLGTSAFHDPALSSRIELLGGRFAFEVDLQVKEILARRPDVDPVRRDRLLDVLGVDVEWHMHAVSDGQRRRVQLVLGLMQPREILLLDEITTDLDLIARQDLLAFLREESERHGTTLLYATHIFDTLERWATDVLYLAGGKIGLHLPIDQVLGQVLGQVTGQASEPLVSIVERWLRRDSPTP
ncbi:MAG TPA: ATP-binding cassette domain-containing protein [Kofleriaceae bacterium]|nr:ATP-binding cassette domain-containing protein [Kofleriaceae bacterium]